ncbi:hypothetical protein ABFS83_06G013900 [Erythranthe nasuta]
MEVKKWIMDARVLLGMLLVQVISTGLQLLSRIVLSQGIFTFALMTYRHAVAALVMMPFAIYFERGILKKLTLIAFFWVFMVALVGITMAMGLFYYGLKETTATYATNFTNIVPILTFLFSTILRIETLGLRTRAGKIKTLGAILCLGGALTIVLYKGKSFHLTHNHNESKIIPKTAQNKTRGTIFLVASCFSYGVWFILQVKLFNVFPYKYTATFLICLVASIQDVVIGLCMDRKPKSWQLGWNLQLITILYSGILATAGSFTLISWAVTQKGPTYPSMFNPLALIFVTITEALFLGEAITVQSLIGMSLIIVGLYLFLWGKHKDMKGGPRIPVKESGGAGGDAPPVEPESVRSQSSAVVVPTASS